MRALLVAALLLVSASAGAETPVERARAAFQEGLAYSEEGDFARAVERYRASLAAKRAPITLYSLGIAQREVGETVEAIHSFRAFLAEPADPADGDVAPYRAAAQQAIDEMAHEVARLAIVVRPHRATVAVDGEPCALGREPCLVVAGEHRVVASAPGYRFAERRLSVARGETASLSFDLEEEGLPWLPIGLVAGGAAGFGGGVALTVLGMSQPGTDAGVAETVAGQVMLGGGLVVGAVGSVLWALAPTPETGDVAILPGTTTSPFGVTLRF